jgi:hypothetical protein
MELHKAAEKQGYGAITATYFVSDGKIVQVVGSQKQNIKVEAGDNARAAELMLSEIKDLFDRHQSGHVTFTLKFDLGNIRLVTIHRELRNEYNLEPLQSQQEVDNL